MLVVSDASPLNVLVRLGQSGVLEALFKSVVIPASVAEELSRSATPKPVRDWITNPPRWVSIRVPSVVEPAAPLRHRGERDAMQLAQELKADAILLDEDKPRAQAAKLGLRVIGTIGILEQSANQGLIDDLKLVHEKLRKTDFYISDKILADSLTRHLAYRHSHGLRT
jgi:predicted nucleic acid-binding protein